MFFYKKTIVYKRVSIQFFFLEMSFWKKTARKIYATNKSGLSPAGDLSNTIVVEKLGKNFSFWS